MDSEVLIEDIKAGRGCEVLTPKAKNILDEIKTDKALREGEDIFVAMNIFWDSFSEYVLLKDNHRLADAALRVFTNRLHQLNVFVNLLSLKEEN